MSTAIRSSSGILGWTAALPLGLRRENLSVCVCVCARDCLGMYVYIYIYVYVGMHNLKSYIYT